MNRRIHPTRSERLREWAEGIDTVLAVVTYRGLALVVAAAVIVYLIVISLFVL